MTKIDFVTIFKAGAKGAWEEGISENLSLSFLWMVLKASQYTCIKLSVKPMNKTELFD